MPINLKKFLQPLTSLPTPSSINYNWGAGSLLGLALSIQLITGILISMHYTSSIEEAFSRVLHISRDVAGGWFIRSIHINGASIFFALLYYHIGKNILIRSFKIQATWSSGVIILLLTIATAFLGYVLPWGQISFWAATVITNLLSAIPVWGTTIVEWLWGGFSVNYPTLTRFFSLHFLLPFIVTSLALIHIVSLHSTGSSNPLGLNINKDKIPFHPFFIWKDLVWIVFIIILLLSVALINPYIRTDPENFIPANPISTPLHIQPEWYFLFAYAILRSIPNKLGGVLALAARVLIWLVKPLQSSPKKSFKFSPISKLISVTLFHTFVILTWIGIKPVEFPFELVGKIYRLIYFLCLALVWTLSFKKRLFWKQKIDSLGF